MAELTPNYNLEKQQGNDYINIEGINGNFDTIDTTLKQIENSIIDISAGDIKLQDGKTIEEKFIEVEGHLETHQTDDTAHGIPVNAKFTDTIYTHPSTHPAIMITGLPTSLPANGGNAATVGGLAPSAFATAAQGVLATNAMPKSGGTATGIIVAQNNTSYTTKQVRNITLSASDPSGGANGDIWIKYKA